MTTDLRKLAEGATQGTWRECKQDSGGCSCGFVWAIEADLPIACTQTGEKGGEVLPLPVEIVKANAAYIAAANPSAIRSLLDQLSSALAEVEELRRDAERYRWLKRNAFRSANGRPDGEWSARNIFFGDYCFSLEDHLDAQMEKFPGRLTDLPVRKTLKERAE